MSVPAILPWREIQARLQAIFPVGTPHREHSVWDIAAKTVFVMIYVDAVEGRERWLRPDQVTRMTDTQADRTGEAERAEWVKASMVGGKGEASGRWYAANTRESIRDDTIRYALIPNGAVIERPGLATTSPAGRYALQVAFAELLDPSADEAAFVARAEAWRGKHLTAGALARIAVVRKGAVAERAFLLVTFPNGETRRMTPGESAAIAKAVIEVFAPRFLTRPGVIFLSESAAKVVARDDDLARAIGLDIPPDRSLPDLLLVDLGPTHPRLVFVEVVASDGPINDLRKTALLEIAAQAGFTAEHVAFVTAYLDRDDPPFRRTVGSLAWGSYAWFASEPERLITLSERPAGLEGA